MSTSIASNGPLPLITYVILYHVLYCTLLLSVTGEINLNLNLKHAFVAIPGLSWVLLVAFHEDPVRILKMSYGFSRIAIRVARNMVRKFVVDRRSTTV